MKLLKNFISTLNNRTTTLHRRSHNHLIALSHTFLKANFSSMAFLMGPHTSSYCLQELQQQQLSPFR